MIVLRMSKGGGIAIGSEPIPDSQLAVRLYQIYKNRADRVLFLVPENDVSSRRLADVIDVIERLRAQKDVSVPAVLQVQAEKMNIQIRLVTARTLNAPCPQDCVNWAVRDFPVLP